MTKCKPTDNWTCITFKPDLAKFNMTELEDDTVALMCKRVYDAAGNIGKNTKVFLNGERLKVKGFMITSTFTWRAGRTPPRFTRRLTTAGRFA